MMPYYFFSWDSPREVVQISVMEINTPHQRTAKKNIVGEFV